MRLRGCPGGIIPARRLGTWNLKRPGSKLEGLRCLPQLQQKNLLGNISSGRGFQAEEGGFSGLERPGTTLTNRLLVGLKDFLLNTDRSRWGAGLAH